MYQLKPYTDFYRENPWDIPYQDRIEKIKKAKKRGFRTAAYIYPKFDSSTFRYRGYNVVNTLDYSLQWRGSWFNYDDRGRLTDNLCYIDVIVLIRCMWDRQMDEFIDLVKANSIKLCYDVDDLIYNPEYIPEIIEPLGIEQDHEINFWCGIAQRYYTVAGRCDAFITTNDFLASYLKKDFDKPCFTLRNYLNWIQEKISESIFDQKQLTKRTDPFEIGYFSGSPTHKNDISMIMPEIESFLQSHSDTALKIVGYMSLPSEYDYLIRKKRITFVPFQSFTMLQYEQAKVDINIAPLMDSNFSNCKSELKYFESAIVGTVTCASPTYTYFHAISHGINGYLCRTGEWEDIFEKIYQNEADDKQLSFIRKTALEEYSGKNQMDRVENILEQIKEI